MKTDFRRPAEPLCAIQIFSSRLRPAFVMFRGSSGEGTAVVLFTSHGGGHAWPGGMPLPEWFLGPTSESVDASDVGLLSGECFVVRRGGEPDGASPAA